MGNPAAQYDSLIHGLCRAAGIESWGEIAASQHLRMGDRLVGLVPDDQSDPPRLSIFIELGQTHLPRDASLHARMLEANLNMPPETPGHFGLHPETQQAVYTFSLGLDEMDGDELAAYLDSQIDLSAQALQAMTRADR
ncbi:CesT family type III secretion system chaperone [Caenimonas koreensis]|nr:CesT family type III secretion system chaperone [Caenimonas koreensis]